jgi:hypothetical protein
MERWRDKEMLTFTLFRPKIEATADFTDLFERIIIMQ